jgi:hypothetical protein
LVTPGFTGIVQDWIDNPGNNTGIALIGDGSLNALLTSKEGSVGSSAVLEIDVNPAGGPLVATTVAASGAVTAGGALTVTGSTTFRNNVTINNGGGLIISGSTGSLSAGGNIDSSGNITANQKLQANGNLIALGNVGIGTTAPSNKLQIESASNPQVLVKNTGTGGFAGIATQTSFGSWYFGCRNNSLNWTVFDNNAGAPRFNIDSIGNVGIGIEAPAVALHVNGIVFATAFTPVSDRRLKKNFTEITGGLESVQKLRPVSYDWRRDEFPEMKLDERRHLGFVAQEIREVLPDVVWNQGEFLRVEYDGIIPVLTRAIQELKAEKDAEIATLKEKVAALEARDVARVTLDAEFQARLARLEAATQRPAQAVTASLKQE